MTNTYITGGNGFIGTRLQTELRDLDQIPIVSIPHEQIHLRAACMNAQIFFLSTYGNMAHHTNRFDMVKANVLDLVRMVAWEPEFLLFMSSSSVLLPVQTPYSRTKRAAEEILQALPELKSCIIRPYSVVGCGEQKEHLIPTLIRSCMEGEEMSFDPNPVHDFIDVEDVVDSLIYCSDNRITGIVELGTGIPHTNDEVRELVEHFCQKKANLRIKKSLRPYDNTEWYCQNRPLWFRQKKAMSESISEMVETYRREH